MRIAVYARVSTEHEAQINALENQLEWYKIEGSRHPDWEIVEVYVDQGITGTQAQKRPEFLRMMEDAQKGKFDLIITREVSRFARNTVDTLSYTRELKARGVDVFFINDGINTATNDGELRLTIMSSMAQDESRKISERVKAGQKVSREKHVLYGSGNILGYRRENGTYVPDPDQAETVRLIFQMYSTGENGLVKIVNELYPTAHIVQEAYTGTSILRPEWSKLYRILKKGDTVVFDSVSRMSRNAEEGFSLYEDLYHKGIRLVFLKEHHIDTETYQKALSGSIAMTGTNVDFILKGINEYLMALAKEQIKLAFEQSEKEVADLHQRTREGLVTAKLNGKQVGRKKGTGFETKKSKAAKEKIRIHCKAFGGTLDDVECMKLTGLARNTYYKYKRQIRAELADEEKT